MEVVRDAKAFEANGGADGALVYDLGLVALVEDVFTGHFSQRVGHRAVCSYCIRPFRSAASYALESVSLGLLSSRPGRQQSGESAGPTMRSSCDSK